MFTWKRLFLMVSLLAIAVLGMHLVNVPEVAAQVRATLVRDVDEPARIPYFHSAVPTCPFGNQCLVTGPAVPANKRLRVTRISGNSFYTNVNAFGALHVNSTGSGRMLVAFPIVPFNAAYYGSALAFNHEVDAYFESGESPVLEIGVPAGAGGISDASSFNRLTIVGYMVDLP